MRRSFRCGTFSVSPKSGSTTHVMTAGLSSSAVSCRSRNGLSPASPSWQGLLTIESAQLLRVASERVGSFLRLAGSLTARASACSTRRRGPRRPAGDAA